MNPLQINDVVKQLNEISGLFDTGQRILPFLQDATKFLQEIAPLLEEIDISIQESNHKIPRAASRIHDVSEATEMATNEILDLADEVMDHMDESTAKCKNFVSDIKMLSSSDEELLNALRDHFGGQPAEDLLQRIERLHAQKKEAYERILVDIESEHKVQDLIRNKMGKIMMALQVQDITSQQLAAVKHLIDSVRSRMENLSGRINIADSERSKEVRQVPRHGVVFDVNAEYDRSGKRQEDAEAIVNAFQQTSDLEALERQVQAEQAEIDAAIENSFGPPKPTVPASEPATAPAETASADDINALFGGDGAQPETASSDDIEALFGGDAAQETASSDDIEALFGGEAAQETASSDDIEALFGGSAAQETASSDDIEALFGGSAAQETASSDDIEALFGGSAAQETASSDDIEALFGGSAAQETASSDDIEALFGGSAAQETASADDIEALFGSEAGQETASADDIDKLFGG